MTTVLATQTVVLQNRLNDFGQFIITEVKKAAKWELEQFPFWLLRIMSKEQFAFFGSLQHELGEAGAHRWLCTMLVITGRFAWTDDAQSVKFIKDSPRQAHQP